VSIESLRSRSASGKGSDAILHGDARARIGEIFSQADHDPRLRGSLLPIGVLLCPAGSEEEEAFGDLPGR
jgi:hypothetical protein